MTPTHTARPALALRPQLRPGEALDSYLERLAAVNLLDHPTLIRLLGPTSTGSVNLAFQTATLTRLADLVSQPRESLVAGTLRGAAGGADYSMNPNEPCPRHNVAQAGWTARHGSQLCPDCLCTDGIWRIAWRHPFVMSCLAHRTWLLADCPTCVKPFRSHRTRLRPVDAAPGSCGNPGGARGWSCRQDLATLTAPPAPEQVLVAQSHIEDALACRDVEIVGAPVTPKAYLSEIKTLTVLLLHLARQPGAERVAPEWAAAARKDHGRSAGDRGARWGLAPPADPQLRGHALAAADQIITCSSVEAAAEQLSRWLDLAPWVPEGRLGWLADHTTMTPTLTRLVMAGSSARIRLSTRLAHQPPIPPSAIPQLVPAPLYAEHIADLLDVTDHTGRLFISLCLARSGRPGSTWTDAAQALGLPGEMGHQTAHACIRDMLCTPPTFLDALAIVADRLSAPPAVDYRRREGTVRRLATRTRWYRIWAREHHPGSHTASRGYALTWLWTEYANGHVDTSPGWTEGTCQPGRRQRDYYRRYARRLTPRAIEALLVVASHHELSV